MAIMHCKRKNDMKTYRVDELSNKGVIRAIAELDKLLEVLAVLFRGLGKAGALLEVGRDDVVALVLVNDAKMAGGGAGLAVDVVTKGRNNDSAGGVDGLEEVVGVAEGDLAKDVGVGEAVDAVAVAEVALQGDGISVGTEPEADDGALGDGGHHGGDGWLGAYEREER